VSSSHETKAPALPSFHDESKANLLPFAVVCAAWVVPLLKFWAMVWGLFRPFDYAGGDVAPRPWAFAAGCIVCAAVWWLPVSYYRIRRFERDGRVYELLGVRLFRMLVPNGDLVNRWRRRQDPRFRVITNDASAEAFLGRTIVGEKTHLVSFVIGVASSSFAWQIGWLGWAIYLFGANVLFNVYPILLQRYTRARIGRLLTRRPA
jgi:hypothetical protein